MKNRHTFSQPLLLALLAALFSLDAINSRAQPLTEAFTSVIPSPLLACAPTRATAMTTTDTDDPSALIADSVTVRVSNRGIELWRGEDSDIRSADWFIASGDGQAPTGTEFADLAQGLVAPQRALVSWCDRGCRRRDVLLFGGGYDPGFERATSPPAHSRGNALFMVDTASGERLWSAGSGGDHDVDDDDFRHSIVAALTLVDRDGDCLTDTLFAPDITGQLFRFDFNAVADTAGDLARGGRIADLGDGGGQPFRRFFNAVDIAPIITATGASVFSLSLASGNHRQPHSTDVENALFVLFDPYTDRAPNDYRYVDGRDIVTPAALSDAGVTPTSAFGWMLALQDRGEKALFATITFQHRLFLTTATPVSFHPGAKQSLLSRIYLLDIRNGATLLRRDGDGELLLAQRDRADTSTTLPWYSLGPLPVTAAPALLMNPEPACGAQCANALSTLDAAMTSVTPCLGDHCLPLEIDLALHKIFWRNEP